MKGCLLQVSGFVIGLFLVSSCYGQHTITRDDFPRLAMFVDTVYASTASSPALPAEGLDQVWDYSTLVLDEIVLTEYFDATESKEFPDAHNVRERNLIFQVFPIASQHYEGIDDEGWYDLGRTNAGAQYSISAFTGGPTDTLFFIGADLPFEGRSNVLQFPMTYGDAWQGVHTEITKYALSVAAFGLNRTPGELRRTMTQNRSVVGSGQLILPNADGSPTAPMDVLLLKVERIAQDSVFLGGVPAPPPLMAAFGLTQGMISSDIFYVFYTPGFGAFVFSLTIGENVAFYRPQAAEGISSVFGTQVKETHFFPNPIAAGQVLTIQAELPEQEVTVSILDPIGRIVERTLFSHSDSGQIQLQIPEKLKDGIWMYTLHDRVGRLIGSGRFLTYQ